MAEKLGTLTLRMFDGARLPLAGKDILVSLWDGNQRRVHWAYHTASSVQFTIPLADNFVDSYRVAVSAKGYRDAGQTNVRVSDEPAQVDLMLLPRKAKFEFAGLAGLNGDLGRLVTAHLTSRYGSATEDTYILLQKEFSEGLATVLNIAGAFTGFAQHPLSFAEKFNSLAPDRFFAEAQDAFVGFLESATKEGLFQVAPHGLHPGSDFSYKEVRYPEANVQFTITRLPDHKVTIDADIDYFSDLASHFFLEVFPQDLIPAILGTAKRLTNPMVVYALRWMAMQRKSAGAGLTFQPAYKIVSAE